MYDLVTIIGYTGIFYFIWRLFSNSVFFIISRARRRIVNYEINLTEKFGHWAVITGSTDGIGKGYAKELAKRGMNVILISRNKEKLENTAREISTESNVQTKIIEADFIDGLPIYERIKKEIHGLDIGILVNNVAVGLTPIYFDDFSSQYLEQYVNVNVNSTLQMINMILPQMKKRKKGAIVNVSSILDDLPSPLFSPYGASKSFMRSFSLALQYECSSFGVTVQILSPGFVKTKIHDFSKLIQKQPSFLMPSPQAYCQQAVDTLGIYDDTTGYLIHEIQYALLNLIPMKLKLYVSWIIARTLQREHSKKHIE